MFQFNSSKLRGKIIEKYGTVQAFSKAIGQTPTTVSAKLTGKSQWTQIEIAKAIELLSLDASDIPDYFFSDCS